MCSSDLIWEDCASSLSQIIYHRCAAVWAGLEFKVGSSATSSLPPFWSGSRSSGPSAMEAWKAAAQQQQQQSGAVPDEEPRRLYAFTPAPPPPSRAETDEWLAQEKRMMEGSQASNSSRSKARTPGQSLSCKSTQRNTSAGLLRSSCTTVSESSTAEGLDCAMKL